MSSISGIVIAVVAVIVLFIIPGPYRLFMLMGMAVVIFGMFFSIYEKVNEIYRDFKIIKEKLKIEEIDEFNMKNEDIEKELMEYQKQNDSNDNDSLK